MRVYQRWDGNTVAVFDAAARARVGICANQWPMLLSVNLLPVGGCSSPRFRCG
jgi:hypothetical protein